MNSGGFLIDFLNIPKLVRDKFEKYLKLIFNDLCAKDNGMN